MAIASTTMAVQRKSSTNAAPCTEKDDYDTTASDSDSEVETEDDESDSSSSLDDTTKKSKSSNELLATAFPY
jgi:hypothetical protein